MIGMDRWVDEPDSPYKHNTQNEQKARQRNKAFKQRSVLYKVNANEIAKRVESKSPDCVLYDVFNYQISTYDLHHRLIEAWLPKIKKGGYLIGRDLHEADIQKAIQALTTAPVEPLVVNGKSHVRLKCVKVNK